MEFNLYELLSYVNAETRLQELDQEYEYKRQEILDSAYPSYEMGAWGMSLSHNSTEMNAIRLVAIEEEKKKVKQRLQIKAERLEKALDLLTDEEFTAFQSRFYDTKNYMKNNIYGKYVNRAIDKVCNYLYLEKEKELKGLDDKRRAELRAFREQNMRKKLGETVGVM